VSDAYAALERDLRGRIQGEVRFDAGSRALYATDASNYRQLPIGVVTPRSREDILATVETCRHHRAPILARGGGTSLAGQCCNAAVVLDMSRHYGRILSLDPEARTARIQPGVVLDDLRAAARGHGLSFGPDPSTHSRCTLGGMLGNNSCGVHSVMTGKTVDNVVSLEVLTYDGVTMEVGPTSDAELARIAGGGGRRAEIYGRMKAIADRNADRIRSEYPDMPRRVSGYNLDELLPERGFDVARALVGSEGTLVTILEATVKLVEWPPASTLLVLGYPDVYAAADHVPILLEHEPMGLEGIDDALVAYLRAKGLGSRQPDLLPAGAGWLIVEFGGDTADEAGARAREAMEALARAAGADAPTMLVHDDEASAAAVWELRESALGATTRVSERGDSWPGWEDSAVRPDLLADYLRELRTLFRAYDLETNLYGHFGDGCVHCRLPFDLRTETGLERYRAFLDEAAELVCGKYGGSLSGEHGDGVARGPLLVHMYSAEILDAFRAFKEAWDPDHRMNPGRIVEADSVTAHLRLGPEWTPRPVTTAFAYPDDERDFTRAMLRCVGVGKCRRQSGGTMCPSYMVTREERHSTRGRARLLFEMIRGEELDGWRDEHIAEALDLCLACKGCKADCPVSVDMATYKAEFRHHHYRGRLRPGAAYSMGLFPWWARLASRAPGLANGLASAPLVGGLLRRLGGVTSRRPLPRFAGETFTAWFDRRAATGPHDAAPDARGPKIRGGGQGGGQAGPRLEGREVILWPDTFSNHLHPEAARAAVRVLEEAGCRVTLPGRPLCCGRPLYDYGMLDLARRQLLRILDVLRPRIRQGVPVVGIEPSCVAVFRDELTALFPDDEDARRLADQTFLLSEFLVEEIDGWSPPTLPREALVHMHCHHRAVLGTAAEEEALARLGLDFRVLESGCCGLAGSFGFERDKYDLSMAVGERALLPAVRAAPDALVITDGFSCRTQIDHGTGRRALHLAEVIAMAMDEATAGRDGRAADQG
jgi:FAD/FMN-containing dehydrogenase/Fe-S oxidoreductase